MSDGAQGDMFGGQQPERPRRRPRPRRPRPPPTLHNPPAFDLPTERAAAEAGAEQAYDRDSPEVRRWKILADDAAERACRANELLISDVVWEIVDEEFDAPMPVDGRAMGQVMKRAASKGLCEIWDPLPGYRVTKPSAREGCHANYLAVWRSLTWRGLP